MDTQTKITLIDIIILISTLLAVLFTIGLMFFDKQIKLKILKWVYYKAPFYHAHQLLVKLAQKHNIIDAEIENYLQLKTDTKDLIEIDRSQYIEMLQAKRLVHRHYELAIAKLTDEERVSKAAELRFDTLVHHDQFCGTDINSDHSKIASKAN